MQWLFCGKNLIKHEVIMNRTLYVSDLDGTLFNRNKKISNKSVEIINKCIDKGMKFSIATARMPYGCDTRLSPIHMNVPGIVTNGVFLYDFEEKRIISSEIIDSVAVQNVLQVFNSYKLPCFLYMCNDGEISIYYKDEEQKKQTQYYSERALESCKEIKKITSFEQQARNGDCVYLAYTGKREELEPICRALDRVEKIKYSFYLNIYNGLYCLEVFGEKASKENALLKLKEYVDCDKLVVFGDNHNDMSMMKIADESYAPNNALPEIKVIVDEILEDCDHDGVALFLEKKFL